MDDSEVRAAIVEAGRRLYDRGLVVATDGNISARLDEERIVCTPTGGCKGFMAEEELCVISPSGELLHGPRPPSSEIKLHLRAYEERPDIRAVVHAHPPHATAFAVAEQPLDIPIMTEVVVVLVGAPLAPFACPSSPELAESIVPHVRESDAVLLAHHGAVTLGTDVWDALYRMETLDHYARILINARQIGGEVRLSTEQITQLLRLRRGYGISEGRTGVASAWDVDLTS